VSDDPTNLDQRRDMAAQKATEIRRHLAEVEAQQAALRNRQAELEKYLLAAPSATWEDAAEKARYLINMFAATAAGRDPRRRKIIASVLDDFRRLSGQRLEPPANE
jgi:peptidoglycan hydrolase CwlO-like protein